MQKIFFILLIIPTLVFSQKKDYNSYDKAVSYLNKGEIKKAKKSIEKCIQKNADWENPYQLLGKIYEEEGDIELAVENYYRGFEKDNPLRKSGDINLWVNSKAYNYVENLHQIWLLALVDLVIGNKEYSA